MKTSGGGHLSSSRTGKESQLVHVGHVDIVCMLHVHVCVHNLGFVCTISILHFRSYVHKQDCIWLYWFHPRTYGSWPELFRNHAPLQNFPLNGCTLFQGQGFGPHQKGSPAVHVMWSLVWVRGSDYIPHPGSGSCWACFIEIQLSNADVLSSLATSSGTVAASNTTRYSD